MGNRHGALCVPRFPAINSYHDVSGVLFTLGSNNQGLPCRQKSSADMPLSPADIESGEWIPLQTETVRSGNLSLCVMTILPSGPFPLLVFVAGGWI